MKKAFMFLGFAMCATFAFAQTNISRHMANPGLEKIDLKKVKQAPVDYKASIFTKENGLDTLMVFTFDNASDYTVGTITATDRISERGSADTAFGTAKHTVSAEWGFWRHYSSTTDFNNNVASDYSTAISGYANTITRCMDTTYNPGVADDGFMFLGYDGTSYAGRVNCYFTLPHISGKTAGQMVVIGITQAYAKYYDRCYIDYQIGNSGTWYTREINVTGIDAEVNTMSSVKSRITMPFNLSSATEFNLRVRAYSFRRGNAYGYFWAIDNLAIIANTNDKSWTFNNATPLDGFYGTMPQGMTIPMTFGVNARNTNVTDITGAKISISASSNNYNQAISSTPITIPMGDIEEDHVMLINERGFYDDSAALTSGYQSWLGSFANYGNTTGNLGGNYQGRSLPTNILGQNFYTVTATESSNSTNMTRKFDTVLYTVSDYREYPTSSANPSGYVWARDNGLIPSYSSFKYAFFVDEDDGKGYITDRDEDFHSNMRGYRVHIRYVTGNTIPTDDQGRPWRLQGMEFIACTDQPDSLLVGALLYPLVYEEQYGDDGYLRFIEVPTGIASSVEVTDADLNSNLYLNHGYMLPTANYKSIKVKFTNQPELKPNTAYRFGYVLNSDSRFNVAKIKYQYQDTDSTLASYASNPETAPYYNQNSGPATYLDVIVIDNAYTDDNGNAGEITGWNIDEYPMIRAIVGDEVPVERIPITIDCSNNTDSNAFYVSYGTESICNDDIMAAVGSTATIRVIPDGDHSVIDSVFLTTIDPEGHQNRHQLTVYNDEHNPEGEMVASDYSIVDTTGGHNETLLERYAYTFYLEDIPSEYSYVVTAYTHYGEYHVGIDPVASNVLMTLAPNPATNSVKLNLSGVNGMVNCNIIDMSGRVVYNANINAEAQNVINVSNMPAGAYFVRVTNDTFSKIEKLIIK